MRVEGGVRRVVGGRGGRPRTWLGPTDTTRHGGPFYQHRDAMHTGEEETSGTDE